MMRWESKVHRWTEADAVLHRHRGRRRNADGQLNFSGFQGGQRLWLGGKDLNLKAVRSALNGDGHCAANLAAEGGEIAVDILSVPIIDALDRAATEMMGCSDSGKRLRLRRTGQ